MISPATLAADVIIGIGQGQPETVILFSPKKITMKLTAEASLVAVPIIRILAQIDKDLCPNHLVRIGLSVHRSLN